MKRLLLVAVLLQVALATFAVSKYEFLIGIRGGGGVTLYQYRGYNGLVNYSLNGAPMSITTNYTEKALGITIPAKAEVLFGVRGFRFGYRFDYAHIIHRNFKRDYDQNPAGLNDYKPNKDSVNLRRNHFTHLFVLEFAIPAGDNFAIVPQAAIGGFRGYRVDKLTGNKRYYKDYLKTRIAVNLGLGFEWTKGRFQFMLAPVYSYQRIQPNDGSNDSGAFHTVTLDLAFRLNLLKPRGY